MGRGKKGREREREGGEERKRKSVGGRRNT